MIVNIITGFFSGIISGMGIGGGAILIPALIFIADVGQQLAQGINLTYFIPTAIVALVVHVKNKRVDIRTALIIGGCGVVGAILGSMVAVSMKGDMLRRMFGIFLFLIGAYEIFNGIKTRK